MSLDQVIKLMAFIDGAFLDSKALPFDGIEVTIKSIKTEEIKNPRTFKDVEKKVCYFNELEWGLVLGAKCNRVKLLDIVKGDSSKLVGTKITIYRDPTVKFGKVVVGAIRIK